MITLLRIVLIGLMLTISTASAGKLENKVKSVPVKKPMRVTFIDSKTVIDTMRSMLIYIMDHEGLLTTPYRCPSGHLTIGVGHVIKPNEKHLIKGITKRKAKLLLLEDFKYCLNRAKALGYTGQEKWAIAHFIFALGEGALKRSTFHKMLTSKTPNIYNAEKYWLKWCHYKDSKTGKYKKSYNLLKQRKDEIKIFKGQFNYSLKKIQSVKKVYEKKGNNWVCVQGCS